MKLLERTLAVDPRRSVGTVWAYPESQSAPVPAALVLAHGAGAGMDHEFVCYFHEHLCRAGFLTVKFNFPYKQDGRKAPDRGPVLEAAYRRVLSELHAHRPAPGRVLIGGKSMGGRIASYLAAAGDPLDGVFLLGYPLHPPRRPAQIRSSHFPEIRCPALFVQGSRDALCDLELLREALPSIPGPVQLHVVEGGDHSFSVPKKSGRSRDEVRREVLDVLTGWAGKAGRS